MAKEEKRTAILQPEVPHYRNEFFEELAKGAGYIDIYLYNSFTNQEKNGFNVDRNGNGYALKEIKNVQLMGGRLLLYNPLPLLEKRYDTLVLMLHFAHLTTWLLLLTKWIHRKRIILWGQGISVKRYLAEERHPDWKLKWQIALADGVWTYERPEAEQWRKVFPKKDIVALDNTLTGVEDILKVDYSQKKKKQLKSEYNIAQETVLIFCARFENNYRRVDLLLETIERLDKKKYGFIIIGAGKNKPDFSKYDNVYDFGAVYEKRKKDELFAIADIYYQPGWVGLSIVEAMAYGKPVCTFRRTKDVYQCVEYCHIEDGINGMVFDNIEDCIQRFKDTSGDTILTMGKNARELVKRDLMPEMMAKKALTLLRK